MRRMLAVVVVLVAVACSKGGHSATATSTTTAAPTTTTDPATAKYDDYKRLVAVREIPPADQTSQSEIDEVASHLCDNNAAAFQQLIIATEAIAPPGTNRLDGVMEKLTVVDAYCRGQHQAFVDAWSAVDRVGISIPVPDQP